MKKGQVEIAAVLIGLIVIIGGVTFGTYTIAKENKYIGDLDTRLVYDTNKCKIEFKNKIKLRSLEEAYSLEFKNAPNCI